MKKYFDEVLSELEKRYTKPITLKTTEEISLLEQILTEFEQGKIGKRAAQLKRRTNKKKPAVDSNVKLSGLAKKIYSDTKLYTESSDALELIEKGYRKGASYNAPGNVGSAFNETLSNEGVMLLDNHNLSLEELALVICYRMMGTELGKQQKDMPRNGIEVPDEIPRIHQDLYLASYLAAKSAVIKYERAKDGTMRLSREGLFAKGKRMVFGGSMGDTKVLTEKIIEADKCYIYDSELDHVVSVPRLALMKWAQASGGAVNSSDTVVLTIAPWGDILYDGWSDKKSLADIQGNSTLNDDFNRLYKRIVDFFEVGILKQDYLLNSLSITLSFQEEIAKIEDGYKNAALGESKYFLSMEDDILASVWMTIQESFYKKNGTSNHVADSKEGDGFKDQPNLAYVRYLMTEGVRKNAKRCKVINRMAIMERLWLKRIGEEIPFNLDTQGIVSMAREDAMKLHSQYIEVMNEYNIDYYGSEIPLGDVLTFHDGLDMLQISKIKEPESTTDYDQYLKRNTQLIMGGVHVSPSVIKEVLGIDTVEDFVKNNKISVEERIVYDNKNKYVTGKSIQLCIIYENGKKMSIGYKVYRSKQGFSGKTSNTIQWSSEVQKKFKENG